MPNDSPNYAIARIDLPDARTHGWQVRLQRRGIKYAKFFADAPHGGAEEALNAARAWRNNLLDRLESEDRARICQRSTRNSSGVVGVSKVSVVTNGVRYTFWQATWSPEPGKRRCVKFSIKRYGDAEAFDLAVKARIEAIGH
ncbi:AP2/ERF family transcription factor [Rubritalea tangerina]